MSIPVPFDAAEITARIIQASQDFEGFDQPRFMNHVRRITDPLFAEIGRLTAERDRMQDIRRLALNPGDTLVFEADRPLTMQECDMQAAAIKAAFPDHHVMVVDQGHFVVVEASNLTREQRAVIAAEGTHATGGDA